MMIRDMLAHLEGRVLGGGPDVVDGGVHQGEGAAVERDAQHSLLWPGAELPEVLQGVVHVKGQVIPSVGGPGPQGRVVTCLLVPLAVIVITHHYNRPVHKCRISIRVLSSPLLID